jgi:hypothetical protein
MATGVKRLASGTPTSELALAGGGTVMFLCAANLTASAAAFSVHDTAHGEGAADVNAIVKEQDAPPNTAVFLEFPVGIDFLETASGPSRVLRLTTTVASAITFHVYGEAP